MRVEEEQLTIIERTLKLRISDAVVYLFGSRADDSKRGGDIDLFLITRQRVPLKEKIQILAQLETEGIQRKVDLIIKNPEHPQEKLYKEVLQKGIRLC
ncbi:MULTISPECIES: nucleotidyltransferase domain-containing protein [unclassified Oceanispirochaeta]|uniref:nucleotidyltransferase domain-containing protein n=1 Tax=unclassified Oceanispirochaeta TaxID=2635722 RepID=UPI000E09D6DC|nr:MULTISPECIES: nucleotidyltransferase domain-containing protein [unclassified Oceanispirochaeta]MBF9018902.1 nucleotidyltransferase domain-containing protein [Oceanispirochaeta sp. M2]NPD75401.1 nucleotidyltransferase domain-containing protein [Oceanispirochaeta sp. M1]RDG28743.1 nucleotidyltransferase domain-containing protein [Oceanispirochaeta sp. M1]